MNGDRSLGIHDKNVLKLFKVRGEGQEFKIQLLDVKLSYIRS